MKPEEAYGIRIAGDLSLDGGLFYTVKEIENGEYRTYIYHGDKKITFSGNDHNPVFNGALYYIRSGKDEDSIIRLDYGSEPQRVASFFKIKKIISAGNRILAIAREKPEEKTFFEAKRLKYRFNGYGYLSTNFHLYDINGRCIFSGDVGDAAANDDFILVNELNDYNISNLYKIDFSGNIMEKIAENIDVSSIAVSERGKIAFTWSPAMKAGEVRRLRMDNNDLIVGSDSAVSIISDSFMSTGRQMKFYNDDLYIIAQERSYSNIYRISDKIEKVTDNNYYIREFDVNDSGLAYIYSTPEKPCIINFNGEIDINNVNGKTTEIIDFMNGEAFFMLYSRDAPTILFIHGGPNAAYGRSYYIEFQYFYDNGYNILYSNPPGSTGYGQEYEKACVGDWGNLDTKYIFDLIEYIRKRYNIKNCFGITGGSYGGYLTNWIVSHYDYFKCGISERSISNLLSMIGTSDIGFWFNAIQLNIDDPYKDESIEKLMKYSPIKYVKNVKTPLMLITGEEDYRCPIEQAEQFFIGLKLNNIDTELIRYLGDNHEHARAGIPKNMIDRLYKKLAWFDRYLKTCKE
ncbi:alpha/beta hydrolase family protein [Picrophilus oshimae]|uniref:Dipeptidyl aminopeptidase/acylaminoacyl peptidase n=1 Tax=Picrophilus torridus (strain ATCC 700027 / DSM 9790 / JCM 10055 / NBRC 100828 / KAW 2/3) TaxID=1122961 RepID=A0A8G2FWF6_PICTO|nr:S9 family peptidase [Picrophilus oshimae]SMD30714.1 Dipeptidyl aminopeptidase/acylaminoacyl peptidase [Picrophilus oshimae DSM 9789]